MPCDTIQTTTVEFGKGTDLVALADAMKALGYTGVRVEGRDFIWADWLEFRDGKLSIRLVDGERRARELRREYSRQIVVSQAQKFGFKVVPLDENRKGVRHVRV